MKLLLILTVLPYIMIILWIISGLLRFRRRKIISETKSPSVFITVIIPARNEEKNILSVLKNMLNQDYPKEFAEFVFIDDASEDNTAMIISEFISVNNADNFKLIKRSSPGKKKAVEEAVFSASGDLIITTDADCLHGTRWISAIAGYYEAHKPAMITGPVVFEDEPSFFPRLQYLEFAGLIGATAGSVSAGYPLMCNGANLAFEKKKFIETGGFSGNEKYRSGDDQFLMMKMIKHAGRRSVSFIMEEDAVVKTFAAGSFSEFWHQRLRWVSKNKGYPDLFILSVAAITWLVNLALITALFIKGLLITALLLFLLKMSVDFIPVAVMSRFFQRKKILYLFPFASVFNLFYVVIIGIAGMTVRFRWKEAKIRN